MPLQALAEIVQSGTMSLKTIREARENKGVRVVPPQVVLFAHSHRRETWHRSKPLDELVNNLQWETVTGFDYLEPDPAAMISSIHTECF